MRPFIGLVGSSGSGKTTLILEALRALPTQTAMMKSVTTRPRRGPEDDLSYEFVTIEEMHGRHAAGYLVNLSEYAAHLYAFDRRVLNATLSTHIGLQALVESAIHPLRAGGYDLKIVTVIPEGNIDQRSEARAIADNERSKTLHHTPDKILHNRFSPGGQEAATQEFIGYLKTFID